MRHERGRAQRARPRARAMEADAPPHANEVSVQGAGASRTMVRRSATAAAAEGSKAGGSPKKPNLDLGRIYYLRILGYWFSNQSMVVFRPS